MYQRVLLAADGSDHSFRAAQHAAGLLENNGTIEVIYVVDGSQSKSDVLQTGDKEMAKKKRRERLQQIEDWYRKKDISYTISFLHGEPGPAIVKYANEDKYDCLVLGSRGLNNLQSMVLGSVSHKVAKRANCPVMIVK
ncbi:Nucleotide-binding universal stress protein, UspA family [Alteribacillus persepolensis]|uniref:Nucleotide-binding universal stress protein, UspA family n=1 Tax=Alteribacillus persepolensis TaxID=568899 RepID=A0A1G8K007_9BACI|nr:universal stress protein [Alteribacillus persepolensis]SDI36709.1 Nucleotide-binding universal stress protein, UspA family [Alteribacillus persepolensis]